MTRRLWTQPVQRGTYTRLSFLQMKFGGDHLLVGARRPIGRLNRSDVVELRTWLDDWLVSTNEFSDAEIAERNRATITNYYAEQSDIDSGKVDPWTTQRESEPNSTTAQAEVISPGLMLRIQRAMERGAIVMAVPYPVDGGSVENVEQLSLPIKDTDTSNHPCMNTRCLHWRYHHRNIAGACEVGICDCKAFV